MQQPWGCCTASNHHAAACVGLHLSEKVSQRDDLHNAALSSRRWLYVGIDLLCQMDRQRRTSIADGKGQDGCLCSPNDSVDALGIRCSKSIERLPRISTEQHASLWTRTS